MMRFKPDRPSGTSTSYWIADETLMASAIPIAHDFFRFPSSQYYDDGIVINDQEVWLFEE